MQAARLLRRETDLLDPPASRGGRRSLDGWLDRWITTVSDLAKFDIAIDRDQVYSPHMKEAAWSRGAAPNGQRFPYGLGWFVFGGSGGIDRMVWHYGWHPDAFSSLFFKVPERQLTLILLACTDRASSVFYPRQWRSYALGVCHRVSRHIFR